MFWFECSMFFPQYCYAVARVFEVICFVVSFKQFEKHLRLSWFLQCILPLLSW